jgi:hypothetical protein
MPWRGPTGPSTAGAAPTLLSSNPRLAEVVPRAWISVVSSRMARQMRRPRRTWTTKETMMIATQIQIHTAVTLHRALAREHVARRGPVGIPVHGLPGRQYGLVLGREGLHDLRLGAKTHEQLPQPRGVDDP